MIYDVIRKSDGGKAYEYQADAPCYVECSSGCRDVDQVRGAGR